MYECLGYQQVKTKNGSIGYFLWLAEPVGDKGVGKKSFQLFVYADQMPRVPEEGQVIEVRFSRNVNPRTNQPYVESVTV